MRVLIVTAGSLGDVAPYTGLGVRLRAAGHDVALAAQPAFAKLITDAGLRFRPLPGDLPASTAERRAHRPGRGTLGLLEFVRLGAEFVGTLGDGIVAAAEPGVDVMLLSATTAPLGYSVAQHHGVPSLGVFLQPVQPTARFPPALLGARSLGRWGNRTAARLGQLVGRRVYAEASGRLRAQLGLAPASLRALEEQSATAGWPVLHGFSPAVVPRPDDWRPELDVVGYWWQARPAGWQPPPELVEFLAAGAPPVFIGFGSLGSDSHRVAALVGPALRRAEVRAVVQSDRAAPGSARMAGDGLLVIGEAPHDWLFPRMAAVVHHAGSGTTAAGLRAGVPAIPVPMLADQPFWAARLALLGVSPDPIPFRRLSAARLGAAIRAVLSDPHFARRTRTLATRIAEEDGAGAVVRSVERLAG